MSKLDLILRYGRRSESVSFKNQQISAKVRNDRIQDSNTKFFVIKSAKASNHVKTVNLNLFNSSRVNTSMDAVEKKNLLAQKTGGYRNR